jgi:hypothetical protein
LQTSGTSELLNVKHETLNVKHTKVPDVHKFQCFIDDALLTILQPLELANFWNK